MDNNAFTRSVTVKGKTFVLYDIRQLETQGIVDLARLPFSIRILLENTLRKLDGHIVTQDHLKNVGQWQKHYETPVEIPFHPARVLMQDFTGVPAVVDLAAMRDAVKALGGDPKQINPLIPSELVVDHSVQVDYFGTESALKSNVAKEYERNGERYGLLKWAQKSFGNFAVVPPNSGICHQVNLERLGRVIITKEMDGQTIAFPDTLVGMDSHTTMINGIGVMGWGVGGIEAEAVMLGQPYFMAIPEVVGVKFTGELTEGTTATDLVLRVTQMLREYGVVEKFVEFFGPGMKQLTIPDRATIANMSPEYGATMGFFPVDDKTIQYLKATDRDEQADIVEVCTKELALFYEGGPDPDYTEVLELDLSTVEPALAGPARPQDRIPLSDMKQVFDKIVKAAAARQDDRASGERRLYSVIVNNKEARIGDGSVVIAAITSCTNTSNPYALLGAGLLAKNAVKKGLKVPFHVKTSLTPGSRVVHRYLESAGLIPYLEALGFHPAAFGCATCIGNSGPLDPEIENIISKNDLIAASVLSGNRNFEARIHQHVKANFLASPMLVTAFALAGRIDLDLTVDPIALDPNGQPVYLKDIMPLEKEIADLAAVHLREDFYKNEYGRIFDGDEFWQALSVDESTTYAWQNDSTYIKNPPYFENFSLEPADPENIQGARALVVLGDTVTTDHISPAGAIPEAYPAGRYLVENGVEKVDFNSYGARRGNHEVMMRGTFGNIRIKNKLVDKEGSFTKKFPQDDVVHIYDAAMAYMKEGTPLIVLGGKEYGTGSSRDWAAKGTRLLGVQAVIAESYERIHRSNLVGMGVLPLTFKKGQGWENLGLDGSETFDIDGVADMTPLKTLKVTATKKNGETVSFKAVARLNSEIDVAYFQHGGILPYVLRKMMSE